MVLMSHIRIALKNKRDNYSYGALYTIFVVLMYIFFHFLRSKPAHELSLLRLVGCHAMHFAISWSENRHLMMFDIFFGIEKDRVGRICSE